MSSAAREATFVVVLVLAFTGCSRGVGATASGTVTYDGKPVPAGVVVRFHPQVAGSSSSLGVTDTHGRYDLRFNANVRGVLPGESVVSFALRESYGENGVPFIPEELRAIRIPASASGHASGLKKKVRPGENVIDIEITEAGGR
jgi:hypothetical protein